MTIQSLKAGIQSKQLSHFLIFSGPEWRVQQIFIEQISKFYSMDIKRVESVASIYPKLKNKSFINQSFIYIVRDDKDFITDEKLQEKTLMVLGDSIIILLLTTTDKRTKFYKEHKDDIVEFEPLEKRQLCKYIKKEIDLNDTNCERLIDVCESDYGRILLEIDKIKCYEGSTHFSNPNTTFEFLLKDGTIYIPPKDAIFDFVDAVLDRQVRRSYNLLEQCYEVNEAVMVMLSVLYNNAKAVLQVQQCKSNDVAKSTGLTPFQINNAKKHLNHYSNDELINILLTIRKCEKGIKTGTIEEQFVLDYVLTSVM